MIKKTLENNSRYNSMQQKETGFFDVWVSEQFLNGTSAQCRLFSAISLKGEKSRIFTVNVYNKTNELQYERKTYMELYKRISLKQKRMSSELTVSNNSLRVVTEKYFCLTLLYCWHSRSIWTAVNLRWFFSKQKRYWCVRPVWPMSITASRQ